MTYTLDNVFSKKKRKEIDLSTLPQKCNIIGVVLFRKQLDTTLNYHINVPSLLPTPKNLSLGNTM